MRPDSLGNRRNAQNLLKMTVKEEGISIYVNRIQRIFQSYVQLIQKIGRVVQLILINNTARIVIPELVDKDEGNQPKQSKSGKQPNKMRDRNKI